MTIGKKITGGYLIVLVLLAIESAIAFYSLNAIQMTYGRFLDVNERLVEGAGESLHELGTKLSSMIGSRA